MPGIRANALLTTLALSAGCSSPGPTPEVFARTDPPRVVVDPAEVPRLRRDADAALAALRAQRFADARTLANRVLERDPRAARARAVLGRVLAEDARRSDPPRLALLERAEGEILLARRLEPDDVEVRAVYAEFLEIDGQVTLAAREYEAVLQSEPRHVLALRAASRLRYELGQERAAAALLERLLAETPDDSAARFRLAQCQLRLAEALARGDGDGPTQPKAAAAREAYLLAVRTFESYRARAPRDDLDGLLGEIAARVAAARLLPPGQTTVEQAELRAALARIDEPELLLAPQLLHDRGVILEQLGQVADARAAYEAALRLDPTFLPALLNLARRLDADGDKPAAVVLWRRALALDLTQSERDRVHKQLPR